jgi:lipopolysaccharide export system protein LptA
VSGRRPVWLGAMLALSSLLAIGVIVAGARPSLVWAAPPFSLLGEALDVRADQVEVDVAAASAVLSGHVELARKDLRVSCPRVEARFDKEGRIQSAHATGRVVIVAGEKGLRGEADEVRLDLAARTAELRGNVRVAQGASSLGAERATVDLATSRVSLEAVRGTLAGVGSAAPAPLSPASTGTPTPTPTPAPAPSSSP